MNEQFNMQDIGYEISHDNGESWEGIAASQVREGITRKYGNEVAAEMVGEMIRHQMEVPGAIPGSLYRYSQKQQYLNCEVDCDGCG